MFHFESHRDAPAPLHTHGDVAVSVDISLSGNEGGGSSNMSNVVLFLGVMLLGLSFYTINEALR